MTTVCLSVCLAKMVLVFSSVCAILFHFLIAFVLNGGRYAKDSSSRAGKNLLKAKKKQWLIADPNIPRATISKTTKPLKRLTNKQHT